MDMSEMQRELKELKERVQFLEELVSQHNVCIYGTDSPKTRNDLIDQNALPPKRR